MSSETRPSSALFKRAEQLKRWEESETNREDVVLKSKSRKIKFSAGCVFLAACASGDKEEVQCLLEKGADINTVNVDGLTALHQSCIDDNLDMVEFLVEHGADVNRGDNEGWTPLHATASCGFVSIAKYLIEHGANVAAVNNDGELPVDIAESDAMEDLLQEHIDAKEIDCDEVRNLEERIMMKDANEWLCTGELQDIPHPKTGAVALHVAAAKGYIKVMALLLQGKSDVNALDYDGWTPLHAAAHWGQKEACEMLVENDCDMTIQNYVGQTAFDIVDDDMHAFLSELKKKQTLKRDSADINSLFDKKSGATTPKRRSSITRMSGSDKSSLVNKDASSERQVLDRSITEEVGPPGSKVKKVEVEIEPEDGQVEEDESTTESSELTSDSDLDSSSTDIDIDIEEKKNRVNRVEPPRIPEVPTSQAPTLPPRQTPVEHDDSNVASWRRPGSFRSRTENQQIQGPSRNLTLRIGEKDPNVQPKITSPTGSTGGRSSPDTQEVVLRRTQSFEGDEKFYRRYMELQARIKATSCPALHSSQPVSVPPARSSSLRERHIIRRGGREDVKISPTKAPVPTSPNLMQLPAELPLINKAAPVNSVIVQAGSQVRNGSKDSLTPSPATPTTPGGSKLSPGNIFKNFFKSFVPPVRDEESETQRKAHAKRVRETRRSTQGVTLEEIKSAEQLVKRKQQQQQGSPSSDPSTEQSNATDSSNSSVNSSTSITATITTATPTVPSSAKDDDVIVSTERRPSWRLRVDNGDRSKFQLEDARNRSSVPDTTTAYVRRPSVGSVGRPSSAPVSVGEMATAETTVTIPLRRQIKPPEDREQDKENDNRNIQATQAVIARRRRPKRRSTGVVHVDMDEIDPDRQEPGAEEESITNHAESGGERSGRSSRLGSTSSAAGDSAANSRVVTPARPVTTENGELDYKKLYEESQLENERLREILKKTEEELKDAKSHQDGVTLTGKNNLSELEKRERRAMERKLSEMEEELKLMEQLRSENQRLKDENGALIRVISKLSK